jgi:hypothetical protein
MNATRNLIDEVSRLGGRVSLDGDRLKVAANVPLPDKVMERLRRHKDEIIVVLQVEQLSPAARVVSWLRSNHVAVTLSADGRRPVLSGEPAGSLPQAYISRLQDLSSEIVELLYEERKAARADRQRYKNSEAWSWPEALDDAIQIVAERNKALERRRETARYCLCQRLAENEWTTKRGRVWVCELCRMMASWTCCKTIRPPQPMRERKRHDQ